MKKLLILILLSFLALQVYSQQLFTGRSVRRGEVLKTYVYPSSGILKSRFTLFNSKGRVVTDSEGFALNMDGNIIEMAFLGIPSDLPPGKYSLEVFCENSEGSDQFSTPVIIDDREFFNEDIILNKVMNNIQSSVDPRKAEQSRQLWAIISSFNKDSQFLHDNFMKPVHKYRESSSFGDRRTYIKSDGDSSKSLHFGTDMAAIVGTPVYAAGDGKVVMAEERIVTGNTVILEHLPGVYTLYYHLDSIITELGMVVRKGTEIGKVGATGFVTGPHLHWELRVSTVPVDPLEYIDTFLIDKVKIMNIIESIH